MQQNSSVHTGWPHSNLPIQLNQGRMKGLGGVESGWVMILETKIGKITQGRIRSDTALDQTQDKRSNSSAMRADTTLDHKHSNFSYCILPAALLRSSGEIPDMSSKEDKEPLRMPFVFTNLILKFCKDSVMLSPPYHPPVLALFSPRWVGCMVSMPQAAVGAQPECNRILLSIQFGPTATFHLSDQSFYPMSLHISQHCKGVWNFIRLKISFTRSRCQHPLPATLGGPASWVPGQTGLTAYVMQL